MSKFKILPCPTSWNSPFRLKKVFSKLSKMVAVVWVKTQYTEFISVSIKIKLVRIIGRARRRQRCTWWFHQSVIDIKVKWILNNSTLRVWELQTRAHSWDDSTAIRTILNSKLEMVKAASLAYMNPNKTLWSALRPIFYPSKANWINILLHQTVTTRALLIFKVLEVRQL